MMSRDSRTRKQPGEDDLTFEDLFRAVQLYEGLEMEVSRLCTQVNTLCTRLDAQNRGHARGNVLLQRDRDEITDLLRTVKFVTIIFRAYHLSESEVLLPALRSVNDASVEAVVAVMVDDQSLPSIDAALAEVTEIFHRLRHASLFTASVPDSVAQLTHATKRIRTHAHKHIQRDLHLVLPCIAKAFPADRASALLGRLMGDRPAELIRMMLVLMTRHLPESHARALVRCMCSVAAGTNFKKWLHTIAPRSADAPAPAAAATAPTAAAAAVAAHDRTAAQREAATPAGSCGDACTCRGGASESSSTRPVSAPRAVRQASAHSPRACAASGSGCGSGAASGGCGGGCSVGARSSKGSTGSCRSDDCCGGSGCDGGPHRDVSDTSSSSHSAAVPAPGTVRGKTGPLGTRDSPDLVSCVACPVASHCAPGVAAVRRAAQKYGPAPDDAPELAPPTGQVAVRPRARGARGAPADPQQADAAGAVLPACSHSASAISATVGAPGGRGPAAAAAACGGTGNCATCSIAPSCPVQQPLSQAELRAAIHGLARDASLSVEQRTRAVQRLMMSQHTAARQQGASASTLHTTVGPAAAARAIGAGASVAAGATAAQPAASAPTPAWRRAAATEDAQQPSFVPGSTTELGCKHYARGYKMYAACCDRYVACRLCHDETSDHTLDRYAVQQMLCMRCGVAQPMGAQCSSLKCRGRRVARYHCGTCNLGENNPDKRIYHCPFCNVCRRGRGLGVDFYHCMRCNACVSRATPHVCVERSLDRDCPICGDNLFTSVTPIKVLPCGHTLHRTCADAHAQRSYTCPLCSKCTRDMTGYFARLDAWVRAHPMPPNYACLSSRVLCNDCHARSIVPYRFVHHKCTACASYNTRIIEGPLRHEHPDASAAAAAAAPPPAPAPAPAPAAASAGAPAGTYGGMPRPAALSAPAGERPSAVSPAPSRHGTPSPAPAPGPMQQKVDRGSPPPPAPMPGSRRRTGGGFGDGCDCAPGLCAGRSGGCDRFSSGGSSPEAVPPPCSVAPAPAPALVINPGPAAAPEPGETRALPGRRKRQCGTDESLPIPADNVAPTKHTIPGAGDGDGATVELPPHKRARAAHAPERSMQQSSSTS